MASRPAIDRRERLLLLAPIESRDRSGIRTAAIENGLRNHDGQRIAAVTPRGTRITVPCRASGGN